MPFQPLKYIFEARPAALQTLLVLHGTGGNEYDLLTLAKRLAPGMNILSVRGNVLENGMPRFFKRLGMGIFDEEDLRERRDELLWFLTQVRKEKGIDSQPLFALGYSNGANMAAAMMLENPDVFAGAALWRPMPPFREWPQPKSPAGQVPVLMSSGLQDPTINQEENRAYAKHMSALGFQVSEHWLQAGHALVQQDIDLAAELLRG